MPLTKIDDICALIVIDLQKGIAGLPEMDGVVARSASLAKVFRERGLPVVLVNVAARPPGRTDAGTPPHPFPPGWDELLAELEHKSGDCLITKRCIGAFTGTSLDQKLRQRGVTQIFMTGVATSIGVESTARTAYDLGYNVVFVEDAMTDRTAEAHQYSVEKIFPRLGEIDTTDAVVKLLQK